MSISYKARSTTLPVLGTGGRVLGTSTVLGMMMGVFQMRERLIVMLDLDSLFSSETLSLVISLMD